MIALAQAVAVKSWEARLKEVHLPTPSAILDLTHERANGGRWRQNDENGYGQAIARPLTSGQNP